MKDIDLDILISDISKDNEIARLQKEVQFWKFMFYVVKDLRNKSN